MQHQDTSIVQHGQSALAESVARSSAGAVMAQVTPTGVDVGAEARWLAWQARGTASDRRSDRIMKRLFVIAMILLAGALIAQVL